jgi:acetolactate synthase-1/2/3 large subunit
VLIDIMKDVSAATTNFRRLPKREHKNNGHLASLYKRRSHVVVHSTPSAAQIDSLIEMIQKAKRPVILCGGGVVSSNASQELIELAENISAPVVSTLMGLGCMPQEHPLFSGMIGMHGNRDSNLMCTKSDLMIAVGARFTDRVALNPERFKEERKIVHIDIDRSEINKNVKADHFLCGDAREILTQLNEQLKTKSKKDTAWAAEFLENKHSKAAQDEKSEMLHPREILSAIHRTTGDNVIVVTDVGQHQMWTAQSFPFSRPRQLITSGGFGAMGFGMGAAMGAKVGNPDVPVVEITGDGCFRMNNHELGTMEHYGVPVITVIMNNGTLGMVRQWQTLIYQKRYSQTTLDRGPDFIKLADAYGVQGYRVSDLEAFEAAFKKALESGESAVIDCVINIDEKVTPMVPSGKNLDDFLI